MIRVTAPSNIAIVKYMGKADAKSNLPANGSVSMTLRSLHTALELREGTAPGFTWNAEPPAHAEGGARVELGPEESSRFLAHARRAWESAPAILQRFGIEAAAPEASFEIRSSNTFPKGAGVASSASSFAALTLAVTAARARSLDAFREAWASAPGLRRALAAVSRQGSGSSCRSFEGPWVGWSGADAARVESRLPELADLVVVIQSAPKPVSSSEAHRRILGSPLWDGRIARANARCVALKAGLAAGDPLSVAGVAWDEAWEMHSLFHTSHPPFTYWEPGTVEFLRWISPFVEDRREPPIVTLDAGANVHVLVPAARAAEWRARIAERFPSFGILEDRQGTGAEIL